MTETQFWALIEPGKDDRKPQERLRRELEACKPDEIVSFQEHFDRHFEVAYAWDLWGAAYLIEGGCSDDGFTDFRYGLIARGRAVYEAAIANPDTLAGDPIEPNEAFGYVAMEVYEDKTGKPMPHRVRRHPDPRGERWEFKDDAENARRLPAIFARARQSKR